MVTILTATGLNAFALLFRLGALLRRELVEQLIKLQIGLAAIAGKQVPLRGLAQAERHALAGSIKAGQPVLAVLSATAANSVTDSQSNRDFN